MTSIREQFEGGQTLAQEGRLTKARKAFANVAGARDPDWSDRAGVELGDVLVQLGEPDAARESYLAVIRSGHPEFAPQAAVGLGRLLSERQDGVGAAAAYASSQNDFGHRGTRRSPSSALPTSQRPMARWTAHGLATSG
jgi:hypothetical protein